MLQHELDRNQELLARIKKLEERESLVERKLSDKLDANRVLQKNLDALERKLEDRDGRLSSSHQVSDHSSVCLPPHACPHSAFSFYSQTVSALKDEVRELKQKLQNQDSTIAAQMLEKQELQEQLDLQRR